MESINVWPGINDTLTREYNLAFEYEGKLVRVYEAKLVLMDEMRGVVQDDDIDAHPFWHVQV